MDTDSAIAACIRAATGATGVRRGERLQRLWRGWGEIVRFHLTGGDVPSVIVKRIQPPASAGSDTSSSDTSSQRKQRSYRVEHCFYRDHAPRSAARLPATRHLAPGLFILEDLDVAGFTGRGRLTAVQRLRCLEWLADFHASFLGVAPDGLWPVGTWWHLSTRPDEHAAMPAGPLKDAAGRIDARLSAARYQTLVHGDAKAANFCLGPDGVAAVDFQYVGGGCGMKDVVYLLESCLDDGVRACDVEALVAHYLARLRSRLPPHIDADALEAEWRALLPLAWADLSRLLAGWGSGMWRPGAHAIRQTRIALQLIGPR